MSSCDSQRRHALQCSITLLHSGATRSRRSALMTDSSDVDHPCFFNCLDLFSGPCRSLVPRSVSDDVRLPSFDCAPSAPRSAPQRWMPKDPPPSGWLRGTPSLWATAPSGGRFLSGRVVKVLLVDHSGQCLEILHRSFVGGRETRRNSGHECPTTTSQRADQYRARSARGAFDFESASKYAIDLV